MDTDTVEMTNIDVTPNIICVLYPNVNKVEIFISSMFDVILNVEELYCSVKELTRKRFIILPFAI